MGRAAAAQLPPGERFTVAVMFVVPTATPVTLLPVMFWAVGEGIVPTVGVEDVQEILFIVVPTGFVVTLAVIGARPLTGIVGVVVESEAVHVGQAPQSTICKQLFKAKPQATLAQVTALLFGVQGQA